MTDISLPKDTEVPNHIALILDGNRRWARARGLSTLQGHKAGLEAGRTVAKAARQLGVHTFTVWGFSTENWNRSPKEVDYLMVLFRQFVNDVRKDAKKENVRFVHLGRKDRLPKSLINLIAEVENETRNNSGYVLNAALDYGGKDEIVRAIRKIVDDRTPPEKIDDKLFESYLDTHDQPYPYVDLFIRTSGEQRTSGLMPWQMEYAEYYWEQEHLPDFTPEKLKEAILDYSRRRRRFGGNDVVEHFSFKPELAAKFEVSWWRLANIPTGMKFTDYAIKHLREQYGLSKKLAIEAARYMLEALIQEKGDKWEKAKLSIKKFYGLIKDELKLAFEPEVVASLEVKLRREIGEGDEESISKAEDTARELYAEVYRISLFQAAKLAHLRVMAGVERRMAEAGMGETHWGRAEDYLQKYYRALKDRIA